MRACGERGAGGTPTTAWRGSSTKLPGRRAAITAPSLEDIESAAATTVVTKVNAHNCVCISLSPLP